MSKARNKSPDRLHPAVEAFITGQGTFKQAVLENPEAESADVARTILLLSEAIAGTLSVEDALQAANSIDTSRGDPNLLIMFYVFWATLSLNRERKAESSALVDRALELVNPGTPPEIRVIPLRSKAELLFQVGRIEEGEDCFREALVAMPRAAARYPMVFNDWASLLALQGKFAEVEAEYNRILQRSSEKWVELYRAYVYLIHYSKTGRIAEIESLDRGALDQLPPKQKESATEILALAEVLSGRAPESLPDTLAAIRELLAGRPDAALALARTDVRRSSGFLYGQDFQDFNLVRCELAVGQSAAARRLLRLRRERGNVNYLDDFFLARAELLDGRFDEAAERFRAAYLACQRYKALPRLEIELKMSCELSRGDVLRLMAGVGIGTPEPGRAAAVPAAPAPAKEAPSVPMAATTGTARLIGGSSATEELRRLVAQYAALDVPVLVTGQTGTGKELVARALHEAGPRAARPFLAVNCGAIAEGLLESELFGHAKGSFTGAAAEHRGLFEEAGGGTILLDEVGEMPPRLQVALLRVLESGEVRPVGSTAPRKIACRVIAATNADLDALVVDKRFRPDLLYRLRRLEVRLPPLAERQGDILPLAERFLAEGRTDGLGPTLAPEVCQWLLAQPWPGNVRELRNVIEKLRLLNSEKLHYGPAELAAVAAPSAERLEPAGPPASPERKTAGPPVGAAGGSVGEYLKGRRTSLRRLDRIRDLFREHRRLARAELAEILGVSSFTVGRDLKTLIEEGFVEKVAPNASRCTHYFRLRSS